MTTHDYTKAVKLMCDYSDREKFGATVTGHWPKRVPFAFLSEEWAQKNHSQTLTRLNERGGLCPSEMLANMEQRQWRAMDENEAAQKIVRIINGERV